MTQDEIIRMAREAGFPTYSMNSYEKERLADFAALVAAHERDKQAEQEPVAWYGKSKTGNILLSVNCVDEDWKPLYAASVKHVQQEPVGEVDIHMDFLRINWKDGRHPPKGTKLYAAPVRTKDLTDKEIAANWAYRPLDFARAVIAADREKNK